MGKIYKYIAKEDQFLTNSESFFKIAEEKRLNKDKMWEEIGKMDYCFITPLSHLNFLYTIENGRVKMREDYEVQFFRFMIDTKNGYYFDFENEHDKQYMNSIIKNYGELISG